MFCACVSQQARACYAYLCLRGRVRVRVSAFERVHKHVTNPTQRGRSSNFAPINVGFDKEGAPESPEDADDDERDQLEEIPRIVIVDVEHDSLIRMKRE